MGKSTELFELIKSFNKAEKKYFKAFSNQFKSEQELSYVELFDLIDAQEEYDETKIEAQLSNRVFAKNLSNGKNYLYHFLLKCLHNFHSGKSVRIQIRELYINAALLAERRLNTHAIKLLAKAEKIALEYEMNHELLTINLLQRHLFRTFTEKNVKERIHKLHNTFNQAIRQIEREHVLQSQYENLYIIHRPNNTPIEALDVLFQKYQTVIDNLIPKDPITFNELSIRCWTNSTYYRRKKKYKEAADSYEMLNLYFDQHSRFKIEYQARYLNFVSNFIAFLLYSLEDEDSIKRASQLIAELEGTEPSNSQLSIHKYDNLYYCKIIYYTRAKQFEKAVELAPEVWSFLIKYRQQLSKTRKMSIYYNYAFAIFMAGEYELSLDWLEYLLDNFDPKIVPDTTFMAQRLQIINHFELNNDILVEHLMRTILRKYRNPKYGTVIVPTIKVIKKILRQPASKKILLQDYCKTLESTALLGDVRDWIDYKYNRTD